MYSKSLLLVARNEDDPPRLAATLAYLSPSERCQRLTFGLQLEAEGERLSGPYRQVESLSVPSLTGNLNCLCADLLSSAWMCVCKDWAHGHIILDLAVSLCVLLQKCGSFEPSDEGQESRRSKNMRYKHPSALPSNIQLSQVINKACGRSTPTRGPREYKQSWDVTRT
jgi:hypothetical protein